MESPGRYYPQGRGNELDNLVQGNAGANLIRGSGGNDFLYGGPGDDTLNGGAGADRFFMATALNVRTNVDRIYGFVPADDTIVLDGDVFTALPRPFGPIAAGSLRIGTTAADADDRIVYDSATGKIWYDADGSGSGQPILFAVVAAGTLLTADDFYLG